MLEELERRIYSPATATCYPHPIQRVSEPVQESSLLFHCTIHRAQPTASKLLSLAILQCEHFTQ